MAQTGNGVAAWLRETREARGWLQKELGHAAGVPPATISRYEQGVAGMKAETVHRLALALTGSEQQATVIAALSQLPVRSARTVRIALRIEAQPEHIQAAIEAFLEALSTTSDR